MTLRELNGVAPQRRNAAPGVDDDGQPTLAGEGHHLLHAGIVEGEALGAGMEQIGRRRPPDAAASANTVVRGRVATGLLQAEDQRPGVAGPVESGQDLLRGGGVAVGIVPSRVGVAIDPGSTGRHCLGRVGVELAQTSVVRFPGDGHDRRLPRDGAQAAIEDSSAGPHCSRSLARPTRRRLLAVPSGMCERHAISAAVRPPQ